MHRTVLFRITAGVALWLLLAARVGAATPFFTNGPINIAREQHTTTLLQTGKLLVAGGFNGSVIATSELYDPTTGTAVTNGAMATARFLHTATLLPNGKVLVTGGLSSAPAPLATAELYDPVSGTWSLTSSMNTARYEHTATLLQNGKVLVAGGQSSTGVTNSAEIYDPVSGMWSPTGPMTTNRYLHTATLLTNGTVLVVSGLTPGITPTTELYDPVAGTWANSGTLTYDRSGHTATLLQNGKVAVTGGVDLGAIGSTEVYDPVGKTWSTSGSLNSVRAYHTATLLPGGKILAIAGYYNSAAQAPTNTAEAYDPVAGTWAVIGQLNTARGNHTATQLPGAQIVLIGGYNGSTYLSSVETYEPTNGNWTTVAPMFYGRYEQTMTSLSNGMVLAAGGHGYSVNTPTNCELYNPAMSNWIITAGMITPRYEHTATLMENGQVLVTGGYNGTTVITNTEIYNPGAFIWTAASGLNYARELHTATLLPLGAANGEVLVAGGYNGTNFLSSAELYIAGVWYVTGAMTTARDAHTATLLPNGNVLVTGGAASASAVFNSVETYNSASGTWTTNNPMHYARENHTATLLPSGKVLVAGGFNNSNTWVATAEIFDPSSGTWTLTGSMNTARNQHTATLLRDGRVLVTGGLSMSSAVSSAEIYDPATGVWMTNAPLSVGRYEAAAALLTNGNVLVAGGLTIPGNDTDSEVFDTGLNFSNAWQPRVTNFVASPTLGTNVILGGALFRGGSEGSGGNGSQDSAADYPLVQFRALESGETTFLEVTDWTTNALATVALTNFPQGWALMTVFVDGIPSQSSVLNIQKGVAAVNFSGLTQYYDGAAEPVTVTTIPPGLTVSVTYNGSSSPPTNVGSYTVVATVNDTNFTGGATNTMQILAENRNFGVDVSHFQDSSGIPETNWVQMYTNGDRFVFCKASEGLTGPDDPTMATNVANALEAGFLVGVYHYAHPENRPTTNGAVMEADHLLSYASNAIAPGMLRPVIDIETGAGVLSPTQMSDWVLAFSQEIVNNRGNGAAPMVYCTQNYANTNFDNQVATTALWIEAPNGTNETYGNPPANGFTNATGVFNNWAFWQYNISGSAGGISPIDLDVCHDEFAPLASYLIPTATPAFKFQSVKYNSGTGFQLSFTNVPGTHFTLLSSTNVSLALSNWTVVATSTEISPGQFQITDSGATNLPRRFYRVRSP